MVTPAPPAPLPPRRRRRDGRHWEGSQSVAVLLSSTSSPAPPPPPPPPARHLPLARVASPLVRVSRPGFFPRVPARCFDPGHPQAKVRGRGGIGPVLGFSGGLTEQPKFSWVEFFPGRVSPVGWAAFPAGKGLLTRKVHSTPITQQAEQSWLHTRRERKTCQSIFPEN
jgi:hypothetical protein